ncbi:hypothetical protein NDU88_008349 [Pleurodeles waltl]|uniref:Uncharacterized protein n=1 Tax=Pleurodeles waltl TaxID=8319 RepID=A0AAV7PPH3_PLEWA|nr:hypothetical protein NDU88_008349 [Pleurodeles waltl]
MTPHSTTEVAPNHLSMGRVVTDVIPHHESWKPIPMNEDREYFKRKRSNKMASRHRRSHPSNIRVGDYVLV